MLCATEQDWPGWNRTGSARSLPTLFPLPRDPQHRAQFTHRPPPPLCQPIFHNHLSQSFGFPRCLEGPCSRRVSHRPLPKSSAGLGYTDSAQRNAATAGAGGGFKGLELGWSGRVGGSEPGGMGETAGSTGSHRDVPMSPRWRTGCPHSHPPAVAAQGCGRKPRPLPLQSWIN